MAEAQDVDLSPEDGGEGESSMMKILMMAVVGLLVIGGGAGGTLFMTGAFDEEPMVADGEAAPDGETTTAPSMPAIYFELDPPFTVSLDNDAQSRYLQVQLAVMSRKETAIDAVRRHRPAIRNNLNFLFAGQKHEEIVTKKGKEKLQILAVEEIREFLKQAGEDASIEALYFTDFVID